MAVMCQQVARSGKFSYVSAMSTRAECNLTDGLIERIHAQRPLRAWSLIVTIYGDSVIPRGGSLWLGTLTTMMAAFGIEAGVVRTAMSRLAKDGWIQRTRIGRQSFYRLSERGVREFVAAGERIYSLRHPQWTGNWTIALLTGETGTWAALRDELVEDGFTALAPAVLIRPGNGNLPGRPDMITFSAETGQPELLAAYLGEQCELDHLAARYERFIANYEPLAESLNGGAPDGEDAFLIRTATIHDYRRLRLRDPDLPRDLLGKEWPAERAHEIAATVYRAVRGASESWLDRNAESEDGPLPRASAILMRRFALSAS